MLAAGRRGRPLIDARRVRACWAAPTTARNLPMRPLIAAILLMLWFLALAPCLHAGDPPPPPTLKGQTFDISFLTEKGKPHDKIVFDGDGAACMALGPAKIAVTCKYHDRKAKVIDFSGKLTDAKGGLIELSGSVTASDIHGSITITPKDDDPKARNFSGTLLTK